MLSKVLPSSRRGLLTPTTITTGLAVPLASAAVHWSARGWGSPWSAVRPELCVLLFWARLTLPLALSLHHDVSVQRPGHGVGQLRTLQKRRHGAAGDGRALGARLCRWLPDLWLGLRGGGSSVGARRVQAEATARRPGHVPAARPGSQRGSSACASLGLGLRAPAPASHPGARPTLPAFSSLSPRPLERQGRGVTSGRWAESFRSRAAVGSLVGRGGADGSAGDGCPWRPNSSSVPRETPRPGLPSGRSPRSWRVRSASRGREARERGAEATALRLRLLAP